MRNRGDIKYLGREPDVPEVPTIEELGRALNWYNHFYGVDDPEIFDWMREFLRSKGKDPRQIETYVKHGYFSKTLCSLSRLLTRGMRVEKYERRILRDFESFLVDRGSPESQKAHNFRRTTRPQNLLIADVDHLLDEFYKSDYRTKPPVDSFVVLKKFPSVQIKSARKHLQEIYEEISSRDPDVREAYSHLSKRALSNYVSFVKEVLERFDAERENLRREQKSEESKKKVQKKKTASDFSKLQFLRHDPGLNMSSDENFSALEQASVVYLFNLKYKELRMLVAGEGGFRVKGTTIRGFDPDRSSKRRVRKPAEVVPAMGLATKRNCEKIFNGLRSKRSPANGRVNSDTLIVKILK